MIRSATAALLAFAALFITLAPDADARPHKNRDWELLGRQSVGFLADKDVVQVGRQDGDFSKIQLRVKKNDIEMLDLKVVYGNGQVDDIPVREIIAPAARRAPSTLRAVIASSAAFSSPIAASQASRVRL
ncbi:MAG TPA: hypothetical protein VEA77_07375 [Hyphomicrobium sp.]|nr:hypothetical protein [Hyphomicrobium sp.]